MGRKNKFATDRDLIKAVRRNLKIDEKTTKDVFQALVTEIKQRLMDGERVNFNEFGNFEISQWKSDMVYDINYKAKVKKTVKTIKFKPSEFLKKKVLD